MRPLVIAHRTCPNQAPENSLEGIDVAAALGAHAVEVDVRVTRDGVPVLVHDRTLWRVARVPVPVELLSHRQLRSLVGRRGRVPVATLASALERLPAGMVMAIDIKRGPGAAPTVAEVARQGAQRRVWLWSKRSRALRRCREAMPEVESALLRDARTRWGLRRFLSDASRLGVGAVSAHWSTVTPSLSEATQRRGLRLFAMARDVDRQPDKLHLLDGVVTDWPQEAADAVAALEVRRAQRGSRPDRPT